MILDFIFVSPVHVCYLSVGWAYSLPWFIRKSASNQVSTWSAWSLSTERPSLFRLVSWLHAVSQRIYLLSSNEILHIWTRTRPRKNRLQKLLNYTRNNGCHHVTISGNTCIVIICSLTKGLSFSYFSYFYSSVCKSVGKNTQTQIPRNLVEVWEMWQK